MHAAPVRGGSTISNLIEPHRTFAHRTFAHRTSANLLYLHPHRASWMRFEHVEPLRTFLNCLLTEIARCIDVFHSRAGWFYCTEPPQTTSLQGLKGVQGAKCTGVIVNPVPRIVCTPVRNSLGNNIPACHYSLVNIVRGSTFTTVICVSP